MTETIVYCKSDCMFSSNPERVCTLKEIELNQITKDSPQLSCGSYVKAEKGSRYASLDMERAMRKGAENGIREKLG